MFHLRNLATKRITKESKIVEANGMVKTLPNSLKRKSPGNLPMPILCSQGNKFANKTSPTKITMTQRIISFLSMKISYSASF